MAYRPDTGIVDQSGGREDLRRGIIRCVGDADRRFAEDALRILRALRFAAVLGFSIEEETAAALRRAAPLLTHIAAERTAVEMTRLLCGKYAASVLRAYGDVAAVVLPELTPMMGRPQQNPYHCYDVFEHTLHALESAPPEPVLRWAVLCHDMGKPACATRDDQGIDHFYGHPAVSVVMARSILERLRFDRQTVDRVTQLVTYHDTEMTATLPCMKRWLNRLGEDGVRQLLQVKEADIRAQAPDPTGRVAELRRMARLIDDIMEQKQCFSRRDLQVNGHDLLALGLYPGKRLGDLLDALLEAVIDGRCPNEKTALLRLAGEWLNP